MEMEVGESYIKKTLRSLCSSYGWSYGIFWRFDPRNQILTVEDAYYDGHAAHLMGSMLVQVHMLGQGIIGEAVIHGKHRWLFNSLEDFQLSLQFSSGIKTIAVIPVDLQGVVQFGSTNENFESLEFLDQVKKFIQVHDNSARIVPSVGNSGQNGPFTSLISNQQFFCEEVSASLQNNPEACSLYDSLQFPGMDPSPGSDHFDPAQISASLMDTSQMDDLSQWLADASKLCVSGLDLEAMLSEDMSSDLGGSHIFSSIPEIQPEKPSVIDANNNQVLPGFGIDFGCEAKINSLPNDIYTSFSECISEVGVHTTAPPKKGLFSELGLDHLLGSTSGSGCGSGSSTNKSSIEDNWPLMKKRKIECCEIYDSWGGKLMQPVSSGGKKQDFGSLKQCMEKEKARFWIDENFSVDTKSCVSGVNGQSWKSEEPPKVAKKRARPGESTRPRPKDRQLISDRIKDLRDLIPNGAKLSIDALLGRTIKHMLFLQNLNKHAEKLKQVEEPKLISQDNSLIQKGSFPSISSSGNDRRNATWAYEVGGSNLMCPIIVEDLNEPGQMLIEMLCEERGYFMEIADIVRGFGLTILKGVMEARNDKIWAHFIVEGNKHVTRMEVFVSLMQILQTTNTSEVQPNTKCESLNFVTGSAPLWGNFPHQVMPLPI